MISSRIDRSTHLSQKALLCLSLALITPVPNAPSHPAGSFSQLIKPVHSELRDLRRDAVTAAVHLSVDSGDALDEVRQDLSPVATSSLSEMCAGKRCPWIQAVADCVSDALVRGELLVDLGDLLLHGGLQLGGRSGVALGLRGRKRHRSQPPARNSGTNAATALGVKHARPRAPVACWRVVIRRPRNPSCGGALRVERTEEATTASYSAWRPALVCSIIAIASSSAALSSESRSEHTPQHDGQRRRGRAVARRAERSGRVPSVQAAPR